MELDCKTELELDIIIQVNLIFRIDGNLKLVDLHIYGLLLGLQQKLI